MIRLTGTILSGSRATEYFTPGTCLPTSDFDFYCVEGVASLVKHLFKKFGVKWDDTPKYSMLPKPPGTDYSAAGFTLVSGYF